MSTFGFSAEAFINPDHGAERRTRLAEIYRRRRHEAMVAHPYHSILTDIRYIGSAAVGVAAEVLGNMTAHPAPVPPDTLPAVVLVSNEARV